MTDQTAKPVLPRLLARGARFALEQSWGQALWKSLRQFPPLQRLAERLGQNLREVPDFEAIAALTLPRNQAFFAARAAAAEIEGMFSDFSMAVMDTALSFQKETAAAGSLLEFGVYKGRSAAFLGRHLAPNERLVLVDIVDYLDPRAIAPFRAATDFVLASAADFKKACPGARPRGFRFIHIDASHEYRATFNELKIADVMLGDKGIIALDDFANLNYSQNIAAIFKYLHTARTDLRIFLVTDQKAYLCRKRDFARYANLVFRRMLGEMASRGQDCCLARTDDDTEYGAFYLRPREAGEQDRFYGLENFRSKFERI